MKIEICDGCKQQKPKSETKSWVQIYVGYGNSSGITEMDYFDICPQCAPTRNVLSFLHGAREVLTEYINDQTSRSQTLTL